MEPFDLEHKKKTDRQIENNLLIAHWIFSGATYESKQNYTDDSFLKQTAFLN